MSLNLLQDDKNESSSRKSSSSSLEVNIGTGDSRSSLTSCFDGLDCDDEHQNNYGGNMEEYMFDDDSEEFSSDLDDEHAEYDEHASGQQSNKVHHGNPADAMSVHGYVPSSQNYPPNIGEHDDYENHPADVFNHPMLPNISVSNVSSYKSVTKSSFQFTSEVTCQPISESEDFESYREIHDKTDNLVSTNKIPISGNQPAMSSVHNSSSLRILPMNGKKANSSESSEVLLRNKIMHLNKSAINKATISRVKPKNFVACTPNKSDSNVSSTQEKLLKNLSNITVYPKNWEEENDAKSLTSELLRRGLEIKPIYMTASSAAKVNTLPSNARTAESKLPSSGDNSYKSSRTPPSKHFNKKSIGDKVTSDASSVTEHSDFLQKAKSPEGSTSHRNIVQTSSAQLNSNSIISKGSQIVNYSESECSLRKKVSRDTNVSKITSTNNLVEKSEECHSTVGSNAPRISESNRHVLVQNKISYTKNRPNFKQSLLSFNQSNSYEGCSKMNKVSPSQQEVRLKNIQPKASNLVPRVIPGITRLVKTSREHASLLESKKLVQTRLATPERESTEIAKLSRDNKYYFDDEDDEDEMMMDEDLLDEYLENFSNSCGESDDSEGHDEYIGGKGKMQSRPEMTEEEMSRALFQLDDIANSSEEEEEEEEEEEASTMVPRQPSKNVCRSDNDKPFGLTKPTGERKNNQVLAPKVSRESSKTTFSPHNMNVISKNVESNLVINKSNASNPQGKTNSNSTIGAQNKPRMLPVIQKVNDVRNNLNNKKQISQTIADNKPVCSFQNKIERAPMGFQRNQADTSDMLQAKNIQTQKLSRDVQFQHAPMQQKKNVTRGGDQHMHDSESEYDDDDDYDSDEYNELLDELIKERGQHFWEPYEDKANPGNLMSKNDLAKKENDSPKMLQSRLVSVTTSVASELKSPAKNIFPQQVNVKCDKVMKQPLESAEQKEKKKVPDEKVNFESQKESGEKKVEEERNSSSDGSCNKTVSPARDDNSKMIEQKASEEKKSENAPDQTKKPDVLIRGLQKSTNILNNQGFKTVPVVKKIDTPKPEVKTKLTLIAMAQKLGEEQAKENGRKNLKNTNISNLSTVIKRDDMNLNKRNDLSLSKLDVCKLLSNNKNLTISIVQPATNAGQRGGPNKNNFNLQKNQNKCNFVRCNFCKGISYDLNVCEKCHKAIPRIEVSPTNDKQLIQFNSGGLTKRQFYGSKLKGHLKQHLPEGSTSAEKTFGENTPARKVTSTKRGKAKKQEPVCLTLSSDEEGDRKSDSTRASSATPGPSDDRNEMHSDDDNGSEHSATNKSKSECSSGRNSPQLEPTLVPCRSIRIGSYRIVDKHVVTVTNNFISFPFTTCNGSEEVSIHLKKKDMLHMKVHFGASMPVVFITGTRALGQSLRSLLDMPSVDGPYYDPETEDETQKRICIIPDKGSSAFQDVFCQYFGDAVEVIDKNMANEILVRSTPNIQLAPAENFFTQPAAAKTQGMETRSTTITCVEIPIKPKNPVFHMATYPPHPCAGRISITTEDYECLHPEEFLNDVIIDFYLKYLFLDKLSEEHRNRTHIFSSFFYGRLTTRPQAGNSTEDDPSLRPQKKRHARVKTWTRHIDIFNKDFIIIPVNEKSHWFLAIICFPGLIKPSTGKRSLADDQDQQSSAECPAKQPKLSENSGQEDSSPAKNESPDSGAEDQEDEEDPAAPGSNAHLSNSPMKETEASNFCDKFPSSPNAEENSSESMEVDAEGAATTNSSIPTNETSQDGSVGDSDATAKCESSSADDKTKRSSLHSSTYNKVPCILIFDSLIMPRGHSSIISILREYLTEEWAVKKQTECVFNKDNMKGANLKVPQQDNYSDCGIYVLQYVESFFQTPIMNFTIPIVGLHNWFPEERVKTKRQDIQSMIKRLASDQGTKYELQEYVKPPPAPEVSDAQNKLKEFNSASGQKTDDNSVSSTSQPSMQQDSSTSSVSNAAAGAATDGND